ncbi:MAG TPA: hypothetical protein VMF08_10050 [Candidatus Sulfotelmatobacter sp.]|nr:hypothetical protein [Candidatus Sulfotelmatobacter sp.]
MMLTPYFEEANTGELDWKIAGVFVAGLVSFLKSPGKKNEAGETDVPAFTPPQPLKSKGNASAGIATHICFQFNLTCLV